MKEGLYADLLETWGATLKRLQVTQFPDAGICGGILCPSCSRIHGRTMDAMYPFLHLAKRTKDSSYVDAAERIFRWARHVARPDGSWVGETNHGWKGITVFSVIQLAHCLKFHGDILEPKTYSLWQEALRAAADYLAESMTIGTGNINYPITSAASFALAGEVLENARYTDRAREFAHKAMEYLTPNHLIFGEGAPQRGRTPKGCRAVDLGYNVEESLTGLVLYALAVGDDEVREQVVESMCSHLEFMLPDGAWDNSWGTRNFKWTYWGSRTSDGCQAAYALLQKDVPEFGRAAYQNALLLRECTHGGFLYGGPDYHAHGEIPCIHHTLFHAKALATILDYGADVPDEAVPLPREAEYGTKYYPEIDTYLVAKGDWRGTVTGYDWEYAPASHASGGALSMLWHSDWGPVVSASLTRYEMIEENNMQLPIADDHACLTPRLVLKGRYQSILDTAARIVHETGEREEYFCVEGHLVDEEHRAPESGPVPFSVKYHFGKSALKVEFFCADPDVRCVFPVVCRGATLRKESSRAYRVERGNKTLHIQADLPLDAMPEVFNLVPGFAAVPFEARLQQDRPLVLELSTQQ